MIKLPKTRLLLALIVGLSATGISYSKTATSLSSFIRLEGPSDKWNDKRNRYEGHGTSGHLVHEGSGRFRFHIHYVKNDWWDADWRNANRTPTKTRQRSETVGLGTRQKNNQTYEYTSRWKTKSGFKDNHSFCHIFQFKAIDGVKSFPMITQSLKRGEVAIKLSIDDDNSATTVRTRNYSKGNFLTTWIRVKTATTATGNVRTKFSGDSSFRTHFNNTRMRRRNSTEYHPKWGFYRSADGGADLRTDWVEHKDVKSNRL